MMKFKTARQRVLVVLDRRHDWMTTGELAEALGEDTLSPEWYILLDCLAEAGLLVKQVNEFYACDDTAVSYRIAVPK